MFGACCLVAVGAGTPRVDAHAGRRASQDGTAATRAAAPTRDTAVGATAAAPATATAAAIYETVDRALLPLNAELAGATPAGCEDPMLAYLASSRATGSIQRWLAGARVLGDQLVRARDLPYGRTIDPRDGLGLGPAHLAPLRSINRMLGILVQDAAIRADRETIPGLLGAQVDIAMNTASDGVLASSISAIHAIEGHARSVQELIDRGAIDAEIAAKVLEVRRPLDTMQDLGASQAALGEIAALQAEIDGLLVLPEHQRPGSIGGIRVVEPMRLDSASLQIARNGAEEYLTRASKALADPDASSARRTLAILEHRLGDGEFGDLLKLLAPRLGQTADLLARTRVDIDSQNALLEALAARRTSAAEHADAGTYYLRSAHAATLVSPAAQTAIDALHTFRASASPDAVRVARDAIDACRSSVIDPIILASQSARCTVPTLVSAGGGSGLVRCGAIGLNGAVRIVLADAFGPGTRPADAPTREAAVLACFQLATRFAAMGSYSHSLVAQQAIRDLKAPLEHLLSLRNTDPRLRAELAAMLDSVPKRDPLGFEAAFASECRWLAAQNAYERGAVIAIFEAPQLERLTPNELAFLLAMFTGPNDLPFNARCDGALEGTLVDIRPWFNLSAYRTAFGQLDIVASRAQRGVDGQRAIDAELRTISVERDASAVGWLDVTVPVNIESRAQTAIEQMDAIRALVEKTPGGAARRTTQADPSDN